MLTQLTTVKNRLALDPLTDIYDALLLRAIEAISARFDQETNRTLARTVDATFEFAAIEGEILVPCYPIETVSKFELKTSEAAGWSEQPDIDYLIRGRCFISLSSALANLPVETGLRPVVARVTYTGGYLLPGSDAVEGASRLPVDLEQAAIEQTAFWFQTRDELGVIRQWPRGGDYVQFVDVDLLPSVRETLRHYTRLVI
jgi:hypothetical protein